MGLGGGTIKRRSACALLLALGIAVCIFPSVGGTTDQVASDNNAKIGLNENKNVLEVNAASKKKKSVKKTSKKVKKKSKKKVKATRKVKRSKATYKKVKVRYKYKGKWRYKWVYKKVTYQSYSSSYSSSSSSSSSSSNSGSWSNDLTLDSIMKSGSRFGYSGAHHTGAELEQYGSGDCWAMSDWLNNKFQSAGYESRIITYATSYSSQHKSVQVKINGEWQTAPYRSYGYHYLFV